MRGIRTPLLAGSLAALLAGCQPPPPVDIAPAVATAHWGSGGGAKLFRERRGWTVESIAASAADRAHCVGRRRSDSVGLVFIGGEPESGFQLVGVPGTPEPGSAEILTARFDQGDRRRFEARALPGGILEVIFPTAQYDGTLQAFARSHSVSFEGQRIGPVAQLDLDGSNWAINATDECRRMLIPAPPRGPARLGT